MNCHVSWEALKTHTTVCGGMANSHISSVHLSTNDCYQPPRAAADSFFSLDHYSRLRTLLISTDLSPYCWVKLLLVGRTLAAAVRFKMHATSGSSVGNSLRQRLLSSDDIAQGSEDGTLTSMTDFQRFRPRNEACHKARSPRSLCPPPVSEDSEWCCSLLMPIGRAA